jgi:hypothetical protein
MRQQQWILDWRFVSQKVGEFITFSAERASVHTLLMSWELTCKRVKCEILFYSINSIMHIHNVTI